MPYKINKSVFFNYLFVFFFLISCNNDTPKQYFDANWKETTKENASYYREIPKNEKDLWLINDFYITGEKQFIGQANDSLATNLEGNVTWYFKTGKVQNKARYKNGKQIGVFAVVEGAEGSEEEGWNEKDLYYYEQQLQVVDAVSSTDANVYEYYYTNTSNIASQHTSYVGNDNKNSYTLYFNKKGDTIARLNYNNSSEKWEGKEVLFYEEERRGKNDMNSVKTIHTYHKGILTHTQHYNMHEKLLTECTLKNNKPFNGTFYKVMCRFQKIQQYVSGNLVQEITYNKDAEMIGQISFENRVPNTGVFYNCTSLQTYDNGKLHGKSIQYFNEEDGSIESEFIFKNGEKHGDYSIYQDESLLLEKGRYKKGVQIGEVLYNHNQIDYDEVNDNYYLKTNVKIKENKPYISELSQFSIDDNVLLNTFKLETNNTDKFTYINNGYHSILLEDLNNDGFNDLKITYRHNLHDITTYTYYVFNSSTNEYQHLPELDNADVINVNTAENTIKATYKKERESTEIDVTYNFWGNKLIKKLATEKVYNHQIDSTLVTQIFPIPVNKYPLLATNLPPLKFVQKNKEQQILKTHQNIKLNNEPFSITFPGLVNTQPTDDFNVKITASYNKDVFQKALVGQSEGITSMFAKTNTFAVGSNKPYFIIDDNGHNILYYDNSDDDTVAKVKNIDKNVLLLQFTIDKIHDGISEKTISEVNKPIYMIVYNDKNENLKIDENEIHYITINFQE